MTETGSSASGGRLAHRASGLATSGFILQGRALGPDCERVHPDFEDANFINHRKAYQFISQWVADKVVLDMECGTGYGTAILAELAKHATGIDYSDIGENMKLKQLIFGMVTFAPGMYPLLAKGTGGTDSARYCYSVWLRHLVMAQKNGLNTHPKTVAEIGPGDSIGIGLAALISGCDEYFAFDVVKHADIGRNLAIFEELVTLFKNRTPIPDHNEWPEVDPRLEDYRFPAKILDDVRLNTALESSRIDEIRNSVRDFQRKDSIISYEVPWYEANVLKKESIDMIYSQAVLEHVDDLRNTYAAMYSWLKPAGYISHAIDFKCHGTADEWNGHWLYSDFFWKLMRGKRPYLLNREPYSTHIRLMKSEGFRVICDNKTTSESKYTVDQLASRFKCISEEDLVTSRTFVQGVKNFSTTERAA